MSEPRDDGGPAFPLFFPESKARDGRVVRARDERPGMTLRDYFAAKALPEAIRHECDIMASLIRPEAFRYDLVAETAYTMADAMLKARTDRP